MLAVSSSIFGRILRRARNVYYAPPLEIPMNVLKQPVAPVVHIDATDLARTVATVMAERERYRKPRDIIEHGKSMGLTIFMEP